MGCTRRRTNRPQTWCLPQALPLVLMGLRVAAVWPGRWFRLWVSGLGLRSRSHLFPVSPILRDPPRYGGCSGLRLRAIGGRQEALVTAHSWPEGLAPPAHRGGGLAFIARSNQHGRTRTTRQAGPAPQAHVPEERGTENVQCTPARGAPPGYPVSSFLSLCPQPQIASWPPALCYSARTFGFISRSSPKLCALGNVMLLLSLHHLLKPHLLRLS